MVKDVRLFTRYRDDGMDEMTVERLSPEESTRGGPSVLLWCRTEECAPDGVGCVEEAGISLDVKEARELVRVLEYFIQSNPEVDGGN